MPKFYLLVAVIFFSSLAFAVNPADSAKTECGVILAQDPLFADIQGSVLDQPRVQDLAMMRAGPLRSPILIVGKMHSGKTKLLSALTEKAQAAGMPTFSYPTIPSRNALAEIPPGSFVVMDVDPWFFSIDNKKPVSRFNTHYDRLKSTLEFMWDLKKKGNVTAILTMTYDQFNVLGGDMVGKSVLDRFDIIRMDYSQSRQPAIVQ
jgi:hypothetical protein